MVLIIGGAGQGKLAYALAQSGAQNSDVAYDFIEASAKHLFYDFHLAVKNAIDSGRDPYSNTRELIRINPSIVIICNEIGAGLVPIESSERLFRDTVGRICCDLAESAAHVVRVYCGIPQILKGDGNWN